MFKKQERKEREGGREEKGKRKTLVIDQEGKKCRGKKHTERWKKMW